MLNLLAGLLHCERHSSGTNPLVSNGDLPKCPEHKFTCPVNSRCIEFSQLCDGSNDCGDYTDEGSFCLSKAVACARANCEHGCTMSPTGPQCYCTKGLKFINNSCVDLDECETDGSCDQICQNTQGSFSCSCISGYKKDGTRCLAQNVPTDEPPSILYSSSSDIGLIYLNGSVVSKQTTVAVQALALDYNHRNKTICYIRRNATNPGFRCSRIDNFEESWEFPNALMFPLHSKTHLALDWMTGNWYFLDDSREMIFLCNSTLRSCTIICDNDLGKPKGIALDPTKGYMFFTRWSNNLAMLERALLDGTERTVLVNDKIVYPYEVAVDFPAQQIYWVDTHLDVIERIDYTGKNRKIVRKGYPVQNLFGITVFENNLFVTSWRNFSIIRLNKFNSDDYETIGNFSRPFSIHVVHRQKQPTVDHPCMVNNGGCQHICVPSYRKGTAVAQCLCQTGYHQSKGRCLMKPPSTFVVYGQARPPMIKGIAETYSPKLSKYFTEVMIPILNVTRPNSIDFDVKKEYIYFSDTHTIERQYINGSKREVILSKDLMHVEAVAYDYLGNNIYWTDEGTSLIKVVSVSNTTFVKTVVSGNLSQPKSLAIDFKRRQLYWTDWTPMIHTFGKIERAWLNGDHRETLVSDNVVWPSGLTFDFSRDILYWCDTFLEVIEQINLDKSGRRKVFPELKTDHPYGLAYHNNFLYWTEFQRGTVNRLSLSTNMSMDVLSTEKYTLFEIKVFDMDSQNETSACSLRNGKCDEICFSLPNDIQCSCSDGYLLNEGKCVIDMNPTKQVVPTCKETEFMCLVGHRCLSRKFVCDGEKDCSDGSDEDPHGVCANRTCNVDEFRCDGSRCIQNLWVCDGDTDCRDGTDELPSKCKNQTCDPNKFTCEVTGRCIPHAWTCDSDYDCGEGDKSDEHANCKLSECVENEFVCGDVHCVPIDYVCDGDNDCRDASDEKSCGELCDSRSEIYCAADAVCLPITKKCNDVVDCPDESDEAKCENTLDKSKSNSRPPGAYVIPCTENEFRCTNNIECIRKEFVCDGRPDCLDGSDEKNCTEIKNCTALGTCVIAPAPPSLECEVPSRLCDNGTKCVKVLQLCDNKTDCADGSDEGLRCDEQLCSVTSSCSHYCQNTPEGFTCYCPKGLHLQPDSLTCLESHPCNSWGVCSQHCIPLRNRHKCKCEDDYQLQSDGFTCKSKDSAIPQVIFSNRHELRGVDLHTLSVKALISSLKSAVALDFYHTETTNMIYWTDVVDDKIYRGTLLGESLSNIEVVVQTGLATAEGLAVDWIGGNLYWVESNLDQIEVSKLNGSFRKTLIAGDMDSPRAIALDPRDGYLFWSDWDANAPRIERCSMSGTHRKRVLRVDQITDGAWPNGLTLDYVLRRIYWIDARSDSIHTTTYDGLSHKEVIRGHETLTHPFSIAVFENYVYWTDWRTNSVIRANKWNGSGLYVIQKTLTQPFDVQILHPSRQPRDKNKPSPCEKNNGNCSHLCLISINGTYTCDCPHVMRLSSDNKTCVVVNERIVLFSRSNEIRGVDLTSAYYHTIPTINVPHAITPAAIDFDAANKRIYWADVQMNEVKTSNLIGGPAETIIDSGVEHPNGLAIDWISGNLFVTSSGAGENHISVCNLKGEFISVASILNILDSVVNGSDLFQVRSLSLNPFKGALYWSAIKNDLHVIEQSRMDGEDRKVLVSQRDQPSLHSPQSLIYDVPTDRLYWVNVESSSIQYYDFTVNSVVSLVIRGNAARPTSVVPYYGFIYYSDQQDQAIHKANMTTGENDTILRNNTGNILSIRIYDPKLQTGTNACSNDKEPCQHLCLPISKTKRVCKCATGYFVDPNNPTKCKGIEEFIIYSINWEVKGLSLTPGDNYTKVLGPLSRVSMATNLGFLYDKELLFWGDSDQGKITRIKRDGTNREIVIERYETMENTGSDFVTGLAIDWIAENIYWTDPKLNVIEVSRLNGSNRYVIVSDGISKPGGIAVDPVVGKLFWAVNGKEPRIECSALDGSNRMVLVNDTSGSINTINDITLDYETKHVYWCDSALNQIERVKYDGTERTLLLNHSLDNPQAFTVYNKHLYWIDTTHLRGSIKFAPLSNLSDYTVLLNGVGDSLKDIEVFSKAKQTGVNPCKYNNGGCAELCLFNGTHPVCQCAHGQVAKGGKTCEDYNSFIMYSRVVGIDSIHISDKDNLNAPFPSIQNKELIRNAIGLSYDYKRSLLFYSDIQRGSINAVFFNGTNHTVLVDRQGSVEGLSYESYGQTLYWTCNNEATISRMNLSNVITHIMRQSSNNTKSPTIDLSNVETVVNLEKEDKPRGIVTDSCNSRIFWTNWNYQTPSIQRSFLNGFMVESIIKTNIRMPNAITLDFIAMKLYWSDARLDKIERCETDGTNRIVLSNTSPQHPFDMAVHGNYLFWTDWVLHAVVRANKLTGEDVHWLRKDIPRPMGIVAVHDDTAKCHNNPCLVTNGGCEDECRLDAMGSVICVCFPGRQVQANNPHRCIEIPPGIHKNDTCDETGKHFRCSSHGSCIPFELTCDGIKHCEDGSDEFLTYCAVPRECNEGFFKCRNNRCIPNANVCDFVNDCGDNSDEFENCNCTGPNHFRCANGQCISSSLRCDMDADCRDWSDEKDCPPHECPDVVLWDSSPTNSGIWIPCNHTTACILNSWICDGQNDCWDNSDEENCSKPVIQPMGTKECAENHFKCGDGKCINTMWRCDGDNDCDDGSDEQNCTYFCRKDQFMCGKGECIPLTWQCDSTPDCSDQSDETTDCHNRTCPPSYFRCNTTGRCIPWGWVCDSEEDCTDGSDEDADQGCLPTKYDCGLHMFECLNHKCIDEYMYCDGDDDCGDGSDEQTSCLPRCSPHHFKCKTGICINKDLVCNGINDCIDNSDEEIEECANTTFVCDPTTHFQCNNKICVEESLLCNGENDCGDFSDELKCNVNECHQNPPPCSHICIDKKVGYECKCKTGFKVNDNDTSLCADVNECELPQKPCSQFCRNTLGSFICSCDTGYALRADMRSCKVNSSVEPKLIFTNLHYIREVDFNGQVVLLANNLTNAVALDYDWLEHCIYWSDVTVQGSSIKRFCPTNSSYQVLHSTSLQNPDGLAVDWVGRNLYWCDKVSDTIEVSKLDGRYRRVLINTNLMEPRAITLNPAEGSMYWTDWGDKPYIGKANMDGTNFRYLVNESLGWPNALTISYETNELFYGDARQDYIAMCDLEGNHRRIILSRNINPEAKLHHIFAMTVFEDYIYWTDWELKTVERCNKYSGTDCKTMVKLVHRPMDVHIYHPFRQPPLKNNPCENNGNCSTLCLLTANNKHVCQCPENFVLGPDKTSCIANCTSSHFVCNSTYQCIPFWWRCDTQEDCADGSDEPDHCPEFTCLPGQFQCNNSLCIRPSEICDGEVDCSDGSDEKDCNQYTCMNTQIKCKGNATVQDRCISNTKRCNGVVDCPIHGEDEVDCPNKTCSDQQFTCDNGKCIPVVWVCDDDDDCQDNSDEGDHCKERTCSPDNFKCSNGRCIPLSWKCDGDPDCPNGEDESAACANPKHHSCQPSYFKCANYRCIPGRWRCDYDNDCGDNSDEVNCTMRACSESEFRCGNGKCIRGLHRCDGEYNCDDLSDEMNCSGTCPTGAFCPPYNSCNMSDANCTVSCAPGQFLCRNKQCIESMWKCDGDADCTDGSDEDPEMCAKLPCEIGRHRCSKNICVGREALCDGRNDCGDNSDENREFCLDEGLCPPDQFKCDSGDCVSLKVRCDGFNNCGDNSDEANCQFYLSKRCAIDNKNCTDFNRKKNPCGYGACSQLCAEKKNSFSCHCGKGYKQIFEEGENVKIPDGVKDKAKNSKPTNSDKKDISASKSGQKGGDISRSCTAIGSEASVIVVRESDVTVLSPYKSRGSEKQYSYGKSNFKIQSVDILHNDSQTFVFFTDLTKKLIMRMVMTKDDLDSQRLKRETEQYEMFGSQSQGRKTTFKVIDDLYSGGKNILPELTVDSVDIENLLYKKQANTKNKKLLRVKRGYENPKSIIEELHDPRSIAVDWVAGRLYYIDKVPTEKSAVIMVATLQGRKKTAIIKSNLIDPFDIALHPKYAYLYFTDCNQKLPKIERSFMDGTGRKQLVTKNIVCPSGISIDYPASRLYFVDTKLRTLESTDLNGENRIVVKAFSRDSHRPYKLEIFEDFAYISLYQHENVLRINKFGRGEMKSIIQGTRNRIADIVIVQENKQDKDLRNPCQINSCHDSSLCVLASHNLKTGVIKSCLCPDGLQKSILPNSTVVCKISAPEKKCDLFCHEGKCEMTSTGPRCKCNPFYEGTFCQKFRCSQYCKNGGRCIDLGDTMGSSKGFICQCGPEYTGERCETKIEVCADRCLNGGHCVKLALGIAHCQCPPGFTGYRCENCIALHCENNGICVKTNGVEECSCPREYVGRTCSRSVCENFCARGNCTIISGEPVCSCPSGYAGKKCDRDACQGYCLNGGTCRVESRGVTCNCPPDRTGPRCDTYISTCSNSLCKNGGTCYSNEGRRFCRCTLGWGGPTCQEWLTCDHFCFNGGTCKQSDDPTIARVCACTDDYTGIRCEKPVRGARNLTNSDDKSPNVITVGILIAVTVLLLLLLVITGAYFVVVRLRRGAAFSHVRMTENVEISNPMYLRGEDLDETEDHTDPSGNLRNANNFANPVYESLYSGGEENKTLLSELHGDPLPLDNDSV
ncbi:hypothetical protein RUM44_002900 [Polyplax serrata]|uniref:EGF-like domain-containing protein n=1 Tax=Polyplax serrata TaxID=468196 RepID=A0ABR1AX03_POLSC